jgi:hypothetical protein
MNNTWGISCPLWLLPLVVSACHPSVDTASGTVVHDSAGIEIVEIILPSSQIPTFGRIEPTPLAVIGVRTGDPAQEFGRISAARFLDQRRVLVADGQSLQMRLFEVSGEVIWSLGRRGEGPGEFRSFSAVGITLGDSVRVFDRTNRRITTLNPNGQPIGTLPLEEVGGRRPSSGARFTPNGILVVPVSAGYTRPPSSDLRVERDSLTLYLLDSGGEELANLGTFLKEESVVRAQRRGAVVQTLRRPIPFGRRTEWTTGQGRVFVGTNETFEISSYDLSGTLVRILRVPTLTRRLMPEEVDEYKSFFLDRWGATPEDLRQIEEVFSDEFLPAFAPAFSTLFHDEDGRLWVEEYQPRPELREIWYVFEASGDLLGTVRLSPGAVVHDIIGDLVLLQVPHPLDVPVVQIHRFVPEGGQGRDSLAGHPTPPPRGVTGQKGP